MSADVFTRRTIPLISYTWFPSDQNLFDLVQEQLPEYEIAYYLLSTGKNRAWSFPAGRKVNPVVLAGIEFKLGRHRGTSFNLPVTRKLSKIKPALIIIRGWANLSYLEASLFASRKHVPFIVWMCGRRDVRRENGLMDKLARQITNKLARRVLKGCEFVFAYGSRAVANAVQLGVSEDKIVVIKITIDENHFDFKNHRQMDKSAFRKQMGLDGGPLFITVGQLIPRKGIACLLQAFSEIRKRHKDAQLVLIGSGRLSPLVEQYAQANKGCFAWLPSVPYETIPQYYAASDYAVNPTLFDDWGNIVNESHCAMLPIISSDGAHSADDLIRHGHSGLVYPAGNVNALVEMMEYALANPSKMKAMAKNGYDFIQSQWNSRLSSKIWAEHIKLAVNR